MNSQELHDAISLLDEELVREVDLLRHNASAKKSRRMAERKAALRRYSAVAASVCVLLLGAAVLAVSSGWNMSVKERSGTYEDIATPENYEENHGTFSEDKLTTDKDHLKDNGSEAVNGRENGKPVDATDAPQNSAPTMNDAHESKNSQSTGGMKDDTESDIVPDDAPTVFGKTVLEVTDVYGGGFKGKVISSDIFAPGAEISVVPSGVDKPKLEKLSPTMIVYVEHGEYDAEADEISAISIEFYIDIEKQAHGS